MKKFNAILFVFAISFCASAQTISTVLKDNSDNFFEVIKEVEIRDNDILLNSTEKEKKGYARWRAFWENRVDESGKMTTYVDTWKNHYFNESSLQNRSISTSNLDMEWEQLGPFETSSFRNWQGRCQSICVHPTDNSIVYLGTMGSGVFKSTNALEANPTQVQWECITKQFASLGAYDIELHPLNPEIIYFIGSFYSNGLVSTRNYSVGLFKSIDGGETWELEMEVNPEDEIFLTNIMFDPNDSNIMYLLSNRGIFRKDYRGTDGWVYTELDFDAQLWEMEINPTNSDEIYLSGKNFIYNSEDGGQTYNDITSEVDPTDLGFYYCVDYNLADNRFYVLVGTPDYHSTNNGPDDIKYYNGTDWVTMGTLNQFGNACNYVAELKFAPNGDMYLGGMKPFIKINGSSTFSQIPDDYVHDDLRDIAFSNTTDGLPVFFATDGGICRNSGTNIGQWRSINGNLCILQFMGFDVSESNPEVMGGGTTDNHSWVRDENGTWRNVLSGDGGAMAIDATNELIMLSANGSESDGMTVTGTTKSFFSGYNFGTSYSLKKYDARIKKHPMLEKTFFFDQWGLKKTSDGGVTISNIYPNSGGIVNAFDIGKQVPYTIVCSHQVYGGNLENYVQDGNIAISSDDGLTWNEIYSSNTIGLDVDLTNTPVTDIDINPINDNEIFICFGRFSDGQKVYKTTDKGQSWTNISYNLENIPVNTIEYNYSNGILFVGTDFGLYYLYDNTTTWEKYSNVEEFPEVIIPDITIVESSNEIVLGTSGRGVWRANLSCLANSPELLIDNNYTKWESKLCMNRDIRIATGNTLDIRADITMSEGKNIYVEQGATLILDGTKLSNNFACNDNLWQGIIAELGSEVILKNGATIEKADIGVLVQDDAKLSVTNATFKNNRIAVKIENSNTRVYSFESCDFVSDDYFSILGSILPESFVVLSDVKSVSFKACTFKNESPESYDINSRGSGIKISGATSVNLLPLCSHLLDVGESCLDHYKIRTIFQNLTYGIDCSENYGETSYIKIESCEFKDNFRGALLANFSNIDILSNRFYVGYINDNYDVNEYSYDENDYTSAYGLYLSNTRNYTIEENLFTTNKIGVGRPSNCGLRN